MRDITNTRQGQVYNALKQGGNRNKISTQLLNKNTDAKLILFN